MVRQPLVTVITLTYSQEALIDKCLRSVQAQTYTRWEHVVVDDGSVDATSEIVLEYSRKGVTYVRRRHQGVEKLADAYNAALRLAKGDLVALLDGDDYWPTSKLQCQVESLADERVLLSWGPGIVVDRTGRPRGELRSHQVRSQVEFFTPAQVIRRLLFSNPFLPASGVVVRKSALTEAGGFQAIEGVPFVDFPTWLNLAFRAKREERFVHVNRPVAFWRTHAGQVSSDYRRMIAAHRIVLRTLVDRSDPNRLAELRLSREVLENLDDYFEARVALAEENWKRVRPLVRQSWGTASPSLRLRLVAALGGSFFHFDLFKVGAALVLRLPSLGQRLALAS